MQTEISTQILTEIQARTLQAAVNRVIPADEYPNAWEAGVGDYLHALLTREDSFLFLYQAGLDALDAAAGPLGFAALPTEKQDALLSQTEAAHAPFFRQLVAHTMEGFYAAPNNGGNKDGIAWRMLGFEVTA